MAVFYGLLAAFSWGIADFFAPQATAKFGILRALFIEQTIGLIPLLIMIFWRGDLIFAPFHQTPPLIYWTIVAGLISLIGYLCLTTAFARGKLAIVSPVIASYGAIAAILGLILGERMSALIIVGLMLVVGGLFVLCAWQQSPDPEQTRKSSSIWWVSGLVAAFGSALSMGCLVWLLAREVTPMVGPIVPLLFMRLMVMAVLLLFWNRTIFPLRLDHGARGLRLPLLVGLLDVSGMIWVTLGLATGAPAIVAVMSSLFSAVTIFLAAIILRQRLTRWQWAGAATALFGIAIINFARN